MKVHFDDGAIVDGIMQELGRMVALTEEEEKKALRKIGNEIAKNVRKELKPHRTNIDHKHMDDDVKVHVSSKSGLVSCVIGGGKETGFKWHLVDDGTRNSDGTIRAHGIHFTSRALKASEKIIEDILADTERTVTK